MGKAKRVAKAKATGASSAIDIPEDEQWRIIKESGILEGMKHRAEPAPPDNYDSDEDDSDSELPEGDYPNELNGLRTSEDEPPDTPELFFQAIILTIPMCFLYTMMDMLGRMQYAMHPTLWEEVKRTGSVAPVIFGLVFYSNNRKHLRFTQAVFFCVSIAVGTRLVWIVNKMGYNTIIEQSPPLAVIWIYLIIQMNLTPTIISLAVVSALVRFLKLKIVFN
ncbi:hypothetical protein DL93DRAFT_2113790 [Clavulina sp. PMI_390]|nr:hypothetical protein DL93DRAFT_2113790 [Clavulina sp. PMI_390]